MKRLSIAMAAVAALAFATASIASPTLTGKYSAAITKPASVKGTWTVDFMAHGSVVITHNGQSKKAQLKGSTLTVPRGKSCSTVGTYKVRIKGNKLTFTVIKDPCKAGRKLVLPGRTFIKVG